MSKLSFHERAVAEAVSLASRAAVAVPLLGRLTVGNAEGHGVMVAYHRSPTVVDEIPKWNWASADPESGRLPRSQQRISVLTVSDILITEERRRLAEAGDDSKVVIAWALGNAVMFGELPNWDDKWERAATFGMRVGPEGLRFAAALKLPENRIHVPDTGFTILQQELRLDQLPEEVPVY